MFGLTVFCLFIFACVFLAWHVFLSLTGLPQVIVLPDAVHASVLCPNGIRTTCVMSAVLAPNRRDVGFVVIGLWNGLGLHLRNRPNKKPLVALWT